MSSINYAKRRGYKPIDFFFRGVVNLKSDKVEFVDAFQILNDKFVGRMNVCNYFFIAENSIRINELNIIALDELKNYHQVMRQNFLIPDKLVYSLPITARFLNSDKDFDVLIATLKENGYKKNDLLLSFNSNTLMEIDDEAKARYDRLRKHGYKICINGFGEEFNSVDLFAKFKFEYLRAEANYFDASQSKKNILKFIVKFCSANKIGFIMEGVDSPPQMARFKRDGVKFVTGKSVSKLSRYVTNDLLCVPKLSEDQKAEYFKKLNKEYAQKERKEKLILNEIRKHNDKKTKKDIKSGNIMPSASRPELIKSPYQIRIEKQKQEAKKALKLRKKKEAERLAQIAKLKKEQEEYLLQKEKAENDMVFENQIQNDLALTVAKEEKNKIENQDASKVQQDNDNSEKDIEVAIAENINLQDIKNANLVKEKNIDIENQPEIKENKKAKLIEQENNVDSKTKSIFAETSKSLHNLDNLKFDLSNNFKLQIEKLEEVEPIVGHYNDKGQWVDEEGYIYNGYFDENGEWIDYETFNANQEGYYNEQAQWVDNDGTIYDGYFDEDGRWIDYSYKDENGKIVDNGYFDEKIKKWIPFGYFDEKGKFKRFE